MRLLLNAGAGQPIGVDLLGSIKQRGYDGVRQDIPNVEAIDPLLGELAETGVHPILLVAGGQMGTNGRGTAPSAIAELAEQVARAALRVGLVDLDPPAAIEIGNEPDNAFTYAERPEMFAEAVRLSWDRVRVVSDRIPVISGGIKTTNRKTLAYLAAAVGAGLPQDCSIGYHTYRSTQRPEEPLAGFATRDAEFVELKRIAAGRPIWCTETGWHTAPSEVRYGLFQLRKRIVQFSDEEVADFAEREVRINAAQGAVGFVWFQLNDGPDPLAYEHRFGIRNLDGQWKPVADRLAALGPFVA